jgi:hypothetical protein
MSLYLNVTVVYYYNLDGLYLEIQITTKTIRFFSRDCDRIIW